MTTFHIELLFVVFSGLVFGSFVTLASYRLPRGEDIYVKSSRCPKCDTRLRFKDLWPVLSWALFRGQCRHCKALIPARYPAIELATAALFVLIYLQTGLSIAGVLLSFFAVALMVMVVADFEHYIIPDQVHLVLLPLGMVYHYVIGSEVEQVVIGTLLGAGIGLSLHYGYRFLRKKEGLGFGDVKFLAVAGLWLGVAPMVPFLFFSGVFGVITGLVWRLLKKGALFPFGPSLAAALFLCVLYPEMANILEYIRHNP